MIVILGIPLLSLCITLVSEFTISRKYKNIHNCYYWKPRSDESSEHLKLTNSIFVDVNNMYPKAEWARNGLDPLPQPLPESINGIKCIQVYKCDTCKRCTDNYEGEKCYKNNYSEYKKEEK